MAYFSRNSGDYEFIPWTAWLNKKMDNYDLKSPSRAQIIYRLVDEFIYGRAKARQFAFSIRKTELSDKIATWMYVLDREFTRTDLPTLFIPKPMHRNRQSDFDMFAGDFSDDYWSYVSHILSWKDELFVNDKATSYFWSNLTYYLYRFLSIEYSEKIIAADKLEKELEDEERAYLISEGLLVEDKRAQKRDDDYYRDAGFYRGDRRYD